MTDTEKLYIERLEAKITGDGVSSAFLVQLFELAGRYLNLRTIADYAKERKMSYNGVKKCREVGDFFGVKFVLENS